MAETQQMTDINGVAKIQLIVALSLLPRGTFSIAYYTVRFLTIWLKMCGSDMTLAHIISSWLGSSTQLDTITEKITLICLDNTAQCDKFNFQNTLILC